MHPILFTISGFTLYSFGLMVALGILAGVLYLAWRCRRQGEPVAPYLDAALAAIVCGLIGARLMYFLYYPDLLMKEGLEALWMRGGLVWYGGIFAGAAGAALWLKLTKGPNFLSWVDRMAPSLMLGLAFGRIGCFLAGCCYGAPCSLPWAVMYPMGHPTHPALLHPSPLYESAGALVLALGLGWLESKQTKPGLVTSWFFVGAGILRFLVEATRGDTIPFFLGLSVSQTVSLLFVLLGLSLMGWLYQKQPNSKLAL